MYQRKYSYQLSMTTSMSSMSSIILIYPEFVGFNKIVDHRFKKRLHNSACANARSATSQSTVPLNMIKTNYFYSKTTFI